MLLVAGKAVFDSFTTYRQLLLLNRLPTSFLRAEPLQAWDIN